MKKMLLAALLILPAMLAVQCTQESPKTAEEEKAAVESPVQRGEYLVTVMGCDDCHSPKVMTAQGPAIDPSLRLSGHPAQMTLPAIADKKLASSGEWVLFSPIGTAAVGPWGTSYAANLTPDDTGIGTWSLEQFRKALTQGKSKGLDDNRMLLPPMPWPQYAHLKDEDLVAIFTYLKSITPVNNPVPAPAPPVM
jgi:hypothetical protein